MLPFIPLATASLAVTATAQNIDSPAAGSGATGSMCPFSLFNNGTEVVWVCVTGTAAIPASGASTTSFPIAAGATVEYLLPVNSTFSTIAASTGSTLEVTQGRYP